MKASEVDSLFLYRQKNSRRKSRKVMAAGLFDFNIDFSL